MLIIGRGSGSPTSWPARCEAQTAPPFCREVGVLCYANRSTDGYAYARLPVVWDHAAAESMPRRGHVDTIAVATGKIRIKGSVAKVIEFVPLLRSAFDRYPALAAAAGVSPAA